jgi:hypothetical protein
MILLKISLFTIDYSTALVKQVLVKKVATFAKQIVVNEIHLSLEHQYMAWTSHGQIKLFKGLRLHMLQGPPFLSSPLVHPFPPSLHFPSFPSLPKTTTS